MAEKTKSRIPEFLVRHEASLLEEWVREQLAAVTVRKDLLSEADLRRESAEFLSLLSNACRGGELTDIASPAWQQVRDFLADLSRSRMILGFQPSETAVFIFSLKQPLFSRLGTELADEPAALSGELWNATLLLDKLGLFTVDVYQRSREEIIKRQQTEMLELSTPVVKVWEGILALPLIGTLDSARTQIVMESLLQSIVDTGSGVAIIDITGVPAVDTLVAQHLLKTVSAARLMGAQCVISGIRPQIAQTMVHLGVQFGDVVTKATLGDALRHAFRLVGLTVVAQPVRS